MKKIEKNITMSNGRKRKMYCESFQNYREYIDTILKREKDGKTLKSSSGTIKSRADKRNEDFTGVSSAEEAISMLEDGWGKYVNDFKKKFNDKYENLTRNAVCKKRAVSYVGFKPIVARALIGLPNAMYRNVKSTKKSKVLRFLICIDRSCCVTTKEILEKMSSDLSEIAVLEHNGYRCRIEVFSMYSLEDSYDKTIVANTLLVKSEDQPFDIKRLAFPIVHSAMDRVFGFAWENTIPLKESEYHECGLGRPIYLWNKENQKIIASSLKECEGKTIVVSYKTDINNIREEVID